MNKQQQQILNSATCLKQAACRLRVHVENKQNTVVKKQEKTKYSLLCNFVLCQTTLWLYEATAQNNRNCAKLHNKVKRLRGPDGSLLWSRVGLESDSL